MHGDHLARLRAEVGNRGDMPIPRLYACAKSFGESRKFHLWERITMPMARISPRMKVLVPLAACMLLAACSGGDTKDGKNTNGGESIPLDNRSGLKGTTVTFQMTGLLLLVPPRTDGGRMEALAPRIPVGMQAHRALLGFGIAGDTSYVPRLCETDPLFGRRAIKRGICYVDLTRWSLDPVGVGGEPAIPQNLALPRGVVNVTRGSGDMPNREIISTRAWARATFLAGQPGDSCSLGNWTYGSESGSSETLSLVNVLDWEIRFPDTAFVLVFRRGHDSVERVTLTSSPGGTIPLLLAHIPSNEIGDLPPGSAGTPEPPKADWEPPHFTAFYDVIGVTAGDRRRRPRFVEPIQPVRACPVALPRRVIMKGLGVRSLSETSAISGIKTYGCMLATAEPGP